jgi:Tol biopolymer transport system component
LPQWIVVTVGVVSSAALAAILLRPNAGPKDEPLTPVPFTALPGSEISPVFSPDGQSAAFAWNGNPAHRFQIYVQPIGSHRLTPVTSGVFDSYSPAWSPAGDQIAFLRGSLGQPTSLMMAPSAGGPERELASIESGDPPWNRNLTWSVDGRWLASGTSPPGKTSGIVLISAANGSQRMVTHPTSGAADMMPVFSPDGRSIVFVRDNQRDPPKLERLRLRADGTPEGDPEELPFARCNTESEKCLDPWWAPARQEIVFTVRSGGTSRLWREPLRGGSPQLIAYAGDGASHPAVSPVGDALLYEQAVRDTNIYAVDLAKPAEAAPAIVSTRTDQNPSVSPDGKRVLFESNRSGHDEIWVSGVNGADPVALTGFEGPVTGSARWSPDGSRIAFDSRLSGHPEIYVMDANGGGRRRLTGDARGNLMPCWSGDGKWIYFTSLRSGVRQIWRMPPEGGEAVQVTQQGGAAVFACTDARWIWYMKTASPVTSLWRVPAEGGTEQEMVNSVLYRSAAAAENLLYYFRFTSPAAPPELERLDIATGRTTRILSAAKPVGIGVSLSPDLRKLYFTQVDAEESDLMLVRGFR